MIQYTPGKAKARDMYLSSGGSRIIDVVGSIRSLWAMIVKYNSYVASGGAEAGTKLAAEVYCLSTYQRGRGSNTYTCFPMHVD